MRTVWFVLAAFLFSTSVEAQVTVIKAGKLIQTDEGTVSTNQIIIIRDQKIEAVGKDLPIPPKRR